MAASALVAMVLISLIELLILVKSIVPVPPLPLFCSILDILDSRISIEEAAPLAISIAALALVLAVFATEVSSLTDVCNPVISELIKFLI